MKQQITETLASALLFVRTLRQEHTLPERYARSDGNQNQKPRIAQTSFKCARCIRNTADENPKARVNWLWALVGAVTEIAEVGTMVRPMIGKLIEHLVGHSTLEFIGIVLSDN